MGNFMGRGDQYIQLVKVVYCKLQIIGKKQPTFPLMVLGLNPRPQKRDVSVLPLYHLGPLSLSTPGNQA